MIKTSIVWFSSDLRLHDNETLVRAIEQSQEIVPVYCFDEAHFNLSEFGFKRTGSFRAQFILEALQNLDNSMPINFIYYENKWNDIQNNTIIINQIPHYFLNCNFNIVHFNLIISIQAISWACSSTVKSSQTKTFTLLPFKS